MATSDLHYGMTAWGFRPLVESDSNIAWKLLSAWLLAPRFGNARDLLGATRDGRRSPSRSRSISQSRCG